MVIEIRTVSPADNRTVGSSYSRNFSNSLGFHLLPCPAGLIGNAQLNGGGKDLLGHPETELQGILLVKSAEVELLYLYVQGGPGNTQDLCGPSSVAGGHPQDMLDLGAFYLA